MSYFKTLLLIAAALLIRTARAQSPSGVELSGHVDNDIGSTINISWLAQPFDTRERVSRAHTNAQGDFQIHLPISAPTLVQLSYEGEETPIFLEPGQAVAIRFNADNVAASRHFAPLPGNPDKRAANANNYLREAEAKYTENEAYQVLPDNINLLEKAFLSFLNYRRTHELNLFRQADRRGALTPAFEAFAQQEIAYAYANDRLTYVDLREQTAGILVLARMTMPDTGRSMRWHTPTKAAPGFLYLNFKYSSALRESGSSPVSSACTRMPAGLLMTSKWLSSNRISFCSDQRLGRFTSGGGGLSGGGRGNAGARGAARTL